jgi:hypothetical protein
MGLSTGMSDLGRPRLQVTEAHIRLLTAVVQVLQTKALVVRSCWCPPDRSAIAMTPVGNKRHARLCPSLEDIPRLCRQAFSTTPS